MIQIKPYNLIASRENKKLKQTDVARLVKISKQHYSRLEAGTSNGSIEVWERLSNLFEKSIDYLRSKNY